MLRCPLSPLRLGFDIARRSCFRRTISRPHRRPPCATAAASRRHYRVLGIETSCDDSAIAVVDSDVASGKIVYQAMASQWAEHAPHGGIVPNLAVRAHDRNVPFLLNDFRASELADSVDAVAVTRGPGIKPCLDIGLSAAKDIAEELGKPLIMVNHLQAHALVARLDEGGERASGDVEQNRTASAPARVGGATDARPRYPFLSLVVSGGHSLIVLVTAYDNFRLLGSTLDDSVGEAFDKVARLLQLADRESSTIGRHGGAMVEEAAAESRNHVRTWRVSCSFVRHVCLAPSVTLDLGITDGISLCTAALMPCFAPSRTDLLFQCLCCAAATATFRFRD